jgi:HPt (histidine-containing phosphotransfer) domain-containing protein
MGDRSLAATLVKTFRADMTVQLADLESALAAGDILLARRQVHTIKGAAAYLGARAFQQAARAMERAGGAENLALLRELMPKIKKEFEILARQLDRELFV